MQLSPHPAVGEQCALDVRVIGIRLSWSNALPMPHSIHAPNIISLAYTSRRVDIVFSALESMSYWLAALDRKYVHYTCLQGACRVLSMLSECVCVWISVAWPGPRTTGSDEEGIEAVRARAGWSYRPEWVTDGCWCFAMCVCIITNHSSILRAILNDTGGWGHFFSCFSANLNVDWAIIHCA